MFLKMKIKRLATMKSTPAPQFFQQEIMHLYRFSYPVSKPYRFRWFTPLIIIDGLVFTVLSSLITFLTNVYDMKLQTSPDLGKVKREVRPLSPFIWVEGGELKPKCEPYDLSVGSHFFTTSKGLLYTVDKVY